jgi:hypothetical protein
VIVPLPIPVAERSKARVCGQSVAGSVGSNPKAYVCSRSLAGVAVRNPPGAWMFVLWCK